MGHGGAKNDENCAVVAYNANTWAGIQKKVRERKKETSNQINRLTKIDELNKMYGNNCR